MSLQEVVSLIKGEEGTYVHLTLIRDGKEVEKDVVRRKHLNLLCAVALVLTPVSFPVLRIYNQSFRKKHFGNVDNEALTCL